MIDNAELRVSAPHQTCLIVNVYVLRVEEVAWERRKSFAVWSQHTPRLAAHEFQLSFPHVCPIETQPIWITVACDSYVPRHSTQKVRFKITNHIRAFDVGVNSKTDSGILCAQANLSKLSRHCVVEWDTPKICADARTCIGRAKDCCEVHEPYWSDGG